MTEKEKARGENRTPEKKLAVFFSKKGDVPRKNIGSSCLQAPAVPLCHPCLKIPRNTAFKYYSFMQYAGFPANMSKTLELNIPERVPVFDHLGNPN